MEVNIVVASVAVVVSDRVVVAASVVDVGTVAEDVGGGVWKSNCCVASVVVVVSGRVVVDASYDVDVCAMRMLEKGLWQPKLLLHQ